MTIIEPPTRSTLLSEAMLQSFDQRAPGYDAANQFFAEDFDELRRSGYLLAAVPEAFGGAGLRLADVAGLQRRLAAHAPATAIAVNMHLYWTGVAADLWRNGDDTLSWVLERARQGHVFAAGHGERGNDVPLLASTTTAERVPGGWRFTGHKIFGSLAPVWSYLGIHGMDLSDPDRPQVVHGFVHRDAPGVQIVKTWDTLGMRATSSDDTVLEGVFVPDEQIALVCPAGFGGLGPFQLNVFAWGMVGFAAVYLGIADRAYTLAVGNATDRTTISLSRRLAHHPLVQASIAGMRMKLETCSALLAVTAGDWDAGVEHGMAWPIKLLTAKHEIVNAAWQIVDEAVELSGGAALFKGNRLEQLFRDARFGRVHPGNSLFTREVVGKLALGINPDEQPRWG
ncbi:MAG: acyl-CoA dehydrogenase family protein [Microbacteriaceae bacterium]